jgi:hypothetical protein
MKTHLLALVLLSASTALAQPRPAAAPALVRATTYEACSPAWTFACGMGEGDQRYGTATKQEICERYELRPDGTFTGSAFPLSLHGTYRIAGDKVTLTNADPAATVRSFVLTLSADGEKLGALKRVAR